MPPSFKITLVVDVPDHSAALTALMEAYRPVNHICSPPNAKLSKLRGPQPRNRWSIQRDDGLNFNLRGSRRYCLSTAKHLNQPSHKDPHTYKAIQVVP